MSISLTDWGNAVSGTLAGFGTTIILQPAFVLKTYTQAGLGLPPFRELYRGFVPCFASIVPAEAVCFAAYPLALRIYSVDVKKPTAHEQLVSSLIAGICGAPITALAEELMILQQTRQAPIRDVIHLMKSHPFRGLAPTCIRDSAAAVALFGCPDDYLSKCVYGFLAGALTATVDRIKTLRQTHRDQSYQVIIENLFKTEGVRALTQGSLLRGSIIAAYVCFLHFGNSHIPSYLPSCMHRGAEAK